MNIIKKKIYFVCGGTSTFNIIDSIDSTSSANSSFLSIFKKKESKIEKNEFPQLEDTGIKEMFMCQSNNKKILEHPTSTELTVYTSLDYSSIESASILCTSVDNVTVYPLPNMSNETNIKTSKMLDILKKKLGESVNRELQIKYWNKKLSANQYTNIKGKFPVIDWRYVTNSSKISYNFIKFKRILASIFFDGNNSKNEDSLIFVCSSALIVDILKMFKKIGYNKKTDIIEYSSIWEINIEVNYKDKKISYNTYNKKYPTEYNHDNLSYNGKVYEYEHNRHRFILFNSLENIPLKYIKRMIFYRLNDEQKEEIKKILNAVSNNNKKTVQNNRNNLNLLKFDF